MHNGDMIKRYEKSHCRRNNCNHHHHHHHLHGEMTPTPTSMLPPHAPSVHASAHDYPVRDVRFPFTSTPAGGVERPMCSPGTRRPRTTTRPVDTDTHTHAHADMDTDMTPTPTSDEQRVTMAGPSGGSTKTSRLFLSPRPASPWPGSAASRLEEHPARIGTGRRPASLAAVSGRLTPVTPSFEDDQGVRGGQKGTTTSTAAELMSTGIVHVNTNTGTSGHISTTTTTNNNNTNTKNMGAPGLSRPPTGNVHISAQLMRAAWLSRRDSGQATLLGGIGSGGHRVLPPSLPHPGSASVSGHSPRETLHLHRGVSASTLSGSAPKGSVSSSSSSSTVVGGGATSISVEGTRNPPRGRLGLSRVTPQTTLFVPKISTTTTTAANTTNSSSTAVTKAMASSSPGPPPASRRSHHGRAGPSTTPGNHTITISVDSPRKYSEAPIGITNDMGAGADPTTTEVGTLARGRPPAPIPVGSLPGTGERLLPSLSIPRRQTQGRFTRGRLNL